MIEWQTKVHTVGLNYVRSGYIDAAYTCLIVLIIDAKVRQSIYNRIVLNTLRFHMNEHSQICFD